MLETNISECSKLAISRYVDGTNAVEYFEMIKHHDLEGIVLKEKGSVYEGRRSNKWLKVLNLKYEKCFISGVSKGEFGVYLNYLDGNYAGKIEFMKPEDRKKVYGLIKELI
jgi:DNA ligase-1